MFGLGACERVCVGRLATPQSTSEMSRRGALVVIAFLADASGAALLAPTGPHVATGTSSVECASPVYSRRQAGAALITTTLIGFARVPAANAGDAPPKVWMSGKSDPLRPTSKDKPDGTRKDGKYLSCLNDCVPRKQGPPGPNQLERLDCLEACQQECCTTYEQCTYTIRK